MLDEEVIKTNTQNASERILIANVLIMFAFPALMLGGNTPFAAGFMVALGIIAPINILIFKRTWEDAMPMLQRKYALGLSPYVIALAITLIGLSHQCFEKITTQTGTRLEFVDKLPSLFCSGAMELDSALMPPLQNLSIIGCALSIFFILDSRYILRRMVSYCVIGATILAVFGIVIELSTQLENFKTTFSTQKQSFSTFPDAEAWCAFAIIWMGVAFACALYSSSHRSLARFMFSFRCVMLLCAFVLFASALCTGTPLGIGIACAIFALGSFLLFLDKIPAREDIRRAMRHADIQKLTRKLLAPIIYLLISVSCAIATLATISSSLKNPHERFLVDEKAPITLREKAMLWSDSITLIKQRPVFGWGSGSFPTVFAFEQGSDLGEAAWSSPTSDLIKKLVENGVAGLTLTIIMPLCFFLFQLRNFRFYASSCIMAVTILGILALSVLSAPFEYLAVLSSFWILLFAFFTWNKKNID